MHNNNNNKKKHLDAVVNETTNDFDDNECPTFSKPIDQDDLAILYHETIAWRNTMRRRISAKKETLAVLYPESREFQTVTMVIDEMQQTLITVDSILTKYTFLHTKTNILLPEKITKAPSRMDETTTTTPKKEEQQGCPNPQNIQLQPNLEPVTMTIPLTTTAMVPVGGYIFTYTITTYKQ
jgi:hypothetical protein